MTARRVVEVTVRMSDGEEFRLTRERKRNKVEVVSRHGSSGAYFLTAKADTFAGYVEHLEEESSKEAALSRARGEGA